jgi:hypothetical protein
MFQPRRASILPICLVPVNHGRGVKVVDLTRLRELYLNLTFAQRQYLAWISEAGWCPLNTPVLEDLIRLGLARRDGNKVVATEDGRYVALVRARL